MNNVSLIKLNQDEVPEIVNCLTSGKIIAYPTEAVYGLGCDPFNPQAVYRLLSLKQRALHKGLILVAANWEQIKDLIVPIPSQSMVPIKLSWPGPITWVFPASDKVPFWIRGSHSTVALRISAHPIVQLLCKEFSKPIVSTSANLDGQPPARDARTVEMMFSGKIDCLVKGSIGERSLPTEIRDALSGEVIRAG